jgi:hypothetical protein
MVDRDEDVIELFKGITPRHDASTEHVVHDVPFFAEPHVEAERRRDLFVDLHELLKGKNIFSKGYVRTVPYHVSEREREKERERERESY